MGIVEMHIKWAKRIPVTNLKWTCPPVIKPKTSNTNNDTTDWLISTKHKTTEIWRNFTTKTKTIKTHEMTNPKFWNSCFETLRPIQQSDFDIEYVILTKNNSDVLIHCTNTILLKTTNQQNAR